MSYQLLGTSSIIPTVVLLKSVQSAVGAPQVFQHPFRHLKCPYNCWGTSISYQL
ncbi:hypothetical protein BgiMline_035873, partial [Biomphalaria glabrata]